jgi:hypothetical protein
MMPNKDSVIRMSMMGKIRFTIRQDEKKNVIAKILQHSALPLAQDCYVLYLTDFQNLWYSPQQVFY